MKDVMKVFGWCLVGLVVAFLVFCLVGNAWDAWTMPHPVNEMVGHAPGGLTYGGFGLLCVLIPGFGQACLLAVLAVLLLLAILGDVVVHSGRGR